LRRGLSLNVLYAIELRLVDRFDFRKQEISNEGIADSIIVRSLKLAKSIRPLRVVCDGQRWEALPGHPN